MSFVVDVEAAMLRLLRVVLFFSHHTIVSQHLFLL